MDGGVTPFSSSMAPSGSYILIVVGEPLTEEHKQMILERVNKGLLSWDVSSTGCDLSGLENAFASIIKERVIEGDVLIQHSTESLGVEVLLNPTVRTLKQCVKNLLSTATSHKQLIHTGYTFAGSGSWILENGTFSFAEFLEIFQQADVQSHKRCTLNVHCAEEGEWNKANFDKDIFKTADVALNPPDKVNHVPGAEHLIKCLDKALITQSLDEIMKPSPLVGNIRFNRPTIYMFPSGQGDCALFGVDGFNMLIDGGFHRKPCSWEFVRHLDRLDAVLVTRIGESNVCGVSTLMKRNVVNNANPQIGYVFCNISENKPNSKNGNQENKDDLIVSVVGEGHDFVQTLNDLNLKPHQCWRDSSIDPFVLYHKVGQGTLEMHVLSPPRDSKDMKKFLIEWNEYKEKFSGVKSELNSLASMIPLSHVTSICAILVWRPEDPKDTITRILFPGSTPQNRILEGLEELKSLNILNQPVVTKASLVNVPPTKIISAKVEKSVSRASIPNRKNTASPALSVSSVASKNGDIGGLKKDVKEIKKVVKEVKKEIKKEVKKEIKKDVAKEVRKDIKTENVLKKDVLVKKETKKEIKEVKKVIKKDNKEVKTISDKKQEVKPTSKKESTTPAAKAVIDVKKTTTTKKSITPTKKDVGKPPIVPKTTDAKKSVSKVSELKAAKDVNNKKAAEVKVVAKTKPKVNSAAAPKSSATPKSKPVAVPKPGSKMTKAVAASSIVASAVAVTAAAFELNAKQEVIEDVEPELLEKEVEENIELKETAVNEKSVDDVVSPLPPEALSPTPSDSVSLTPSDTLSSAPLETVSPTPPLPNEPISTEEKDVNEIKDIDQDMPYEQEATIEEVEVPNLEKEDVQENIAVNDVEADLAKHQASSDVMSTSFIGNQQLDEAVEEETFIKTESKEIESMPSKSYYEEENGLSEKYVKLEEDTAEKEVVEEKDIEEKYIGKDFEGENDVSGEKETGEEKDVFNEKDVVEENIDHNEILEEKCIAEEKYAVEDFSAENGTAEEKNSIDFEHKYSNVENSKEVDNQLAGLSMEGSFCAGMTSSADEIIVSSTENEPIRMDENCDDIAKYLGTDDEKNFDENIIEEQIQEKKIAFESGSYFQSETNNSDVVDHGETNDFQDSDKHHIVESYDEVPEKLTEKYDSYRLEESDNVPPQYSHMEKILHDNQTSYDIGENVEQDIIDSKITENKETIEGEYSESHFNKISQIQSMDESFHQDMYENYEDTPNIDDPEMQETSVDEPEEIVRKESVVSITLNDDNLEDPYKDNWRRKSGTESEDDVDIGKYMSKEHAVDEEKLHVLQDTDSDEEDVVKSPTPHAVVDYEGQLDEAISEIKVSTKMEDNIPEIIGNDKEVYLTEKQDFDEKDRDSAEDQDTDDGEMIRHPTPPEMKYSEEEMRDPIGQHFIKTPVLKQGIDITEQPLYEEAEDSESDRSASPIIEQPVFGSTVQADFPELVTVSGGTTPSEPQSPKASFDAKKFATESAMLDALSEHDVSESSTHSPSCQDGSTAFDLQASEKSVIDVQSLQDDSLLNTADEGVDYKADIVLETGSHSKIDEISKTEELSNVETAMFDDNEDNQDDKKDTPSDEEESSSEDENSESHSKDKSDAMGDKSDVERDDRSDMHNDDKSDHHNDGRSDIANDNDDDKSDIHENEQLYRQQDSHVFHDSDYVSQDNIKSDFQYKSEIHYDNTTTNYSAGTDHIEDENQYDHEESFKKQQESASYVYEQQVSSFKLDANEFEQTDDFESNLIGNVEPQKIHSERNEVFSDGTQEHNSDLTKNMSSNGDENTQLNYQTYEKSVDDDSKFTLEYESTYTLKTYESNIPLTSDESFVSKDSVACDQDVQSSSISDQEQPIDKKGDEDDSYAFREDEDRFENSEHISNIHGFSISSHENEDKTTPLEHPNVPEYLQEVPIDFKTIGNAPFDQRENTLYGNSAALHEDISPPHIENINVVENKILSEMSEAQQYENLSQYGENIHTSNEIYSETVLTQNVISGVTKSETNYLSSEKSDANETDYGYVENEMKSFTTSNTYEFSSGVTEDNMAQTNKFHLEESYKTDVHESDFKNSDITYDGESTSENFKINEHFEDLQENRSHSEEYGQYTRTETQFHSQNEITSLKHDQESIEVLAKNGYSSTIADINFNDKDSCVTTTELSSYTVSGKDEAGFELPASELTSEFYKTELLQKETITSTTQQIEHESSYLITNRFHSDSPEDNTMRSDSSPDVPYPADLPGKFSEKKNSFSEETSETYLHSTDDFKNNMNFSSTDGLPLSPKNHSLNANDNNSYAESSEDEGNTVLRGNVSPYAYTNKAYTREEEEDIDGNHIYKEETTEVIKQVEGNNLQALNTNQVDSVMNYSQEIQDVQYNTGANYDFRLEEWGKPMGLPTPPDASQKTVAKKTEKPTLKSKTAVDTNGKAHSPSVSSRSPLKKPKTKAAKESSSSPVYVDLAYVPQHADPHYCDVEFFKKIRAKYYVFSSVNPSKEVLNALLEAKKTWNEDLSVTIIPTYETDTLGYWMAQNRDDLDQYSIDVAPSASRCTVNLQDHQTSCSAYRLEF